MENIYSVLSDLYNHGAIYAFHQARRDSAFTRSLWLVFVARSMKKHGARRG